MSLLRIAQEYDDGENAGLPDRDDAVGYHNPLADNTSFEIEGVLVEGVTKEGKEVILEDDNSSRKIKYGSDSKNRRQCQPSVSSCTRLTRSRGLSQSRNDPEPPRNSKFLPGIGDTDCMTPHSLPQTSSSKFTEANTPSLSSSNIQRSTSAPVQPSKGKPVGRIKCNLCNETFSWPFTLRKHMKVHKDVDGINRPWKCSGCKSFFSTASHLRRHENRAHGRKPGWSSYAGRVIGAHVKLCIKKSPASKHDRRPLDDPNPTLVSATSHVSPANTTNEIGNQINGTGLSRNTKTQKPYQQYKCPYCLAIISEGAHLKAHKNKNKKERNDDQVCTPTLPKEPSQLRPCKVLLTRCDNLIPNQVQTTFVDTIEVETADMESFIEVGTHAEAFSSTKFQSEFFSAYFKGCSLLLWDCKCAHDDDSGI